MLKTDRPVKNVVLGMGNLLLKDEGVGVHIAQAMQQALCGRQAGLEVIDGATSPDVLLMLREVSKLVVVDAVQAGGEPGAIYRFRPEDVLSEAGLVASAHQENLLESLKLLGHLGQGPKNVVIIGVQPKETDWGVGLSAELQRRVPQIIDTVLKEVGLGCAGNFEKG